MTIQYTESYVDDSRGRRLCIKAGEAVIMRIIHLISGVTTLTEEQGNALASIADTATVVTHKCEDPSKTGYSPFTFLADFGLICFEGISSRVALTHFGRVYCVMKTNIRKDERSIIDNYFRRNYWLDWESVSSTEIKIIMTERESPEDTSAAPDQSSHLNLEHPMTIQYTESFVDDSRGKHLRIRADANVITMIAQLMLDVKKLTNTQKQLLSTLAGFQMKIDAESTDVTSADDNPITLLAGMGLIRFVGSQATARLEITEFGRVYFAFKISHGKLSDSFMNAYIYRNTVLDWEIVSPDEIKVFLRDKFLKCRPLTRAQAFKEMFKTIAISPDDPVWEEPNQMQYEILQARISLMTENMLAATESLFAGLSDATKDILTLAVMSERLLVPYSELLSTYRWTLRQTLDADVQPLPFIFQELIVRGFVDRAYATCKSFDERPKLTKLAEMYYYGLEEVYAGSLDHRLVARHLTQFCRLALAGSSVACYPYSVRNLVDLEILDPLTMRRTGAGWNICKTLGLEVAF